MTTFWRSPDGITNANALQALYPSAFGALSEIDALGHRLLARIPADVPNTRIESLVAIAILRRAVTQFLGVRVLFEQSVVDQTKLGIRAQFETLLGVRYLLSGARPRTRAHQLGSPASREARARLFFVAAERRGIYNRQAAADGAWGRTGLTKAGRAALISEAASNLARLNRHFRVQQRAFGPLRCFNPVQHKRRYHDVKTWYQFGFRKYKTTTVRQLANRLGYLWEYDVLYGALSGVAHPTGVRHDISINDTQVEVHHPHMPDAFELLCNWSCNWQFTTLLYLAEAYSHGSLPDVHAVYRRVSDPLSRLSCEIPSGFF